MIDEPLIARARDLWTRLTGVPVSFPAGGSLTVVISNASSLCPPGWAGIVVLGGAGIATAPDHDAASLLRRGLARLPAAAATDPARLRVELPITDVLGPATLAYLDEPDLRVPTTITAPGPVGRMTGNLDDMLASVTEDEAAESSMAEITSDAFVVHDGGRIVAVAGYRRWLDTVAHLCVLTTVEHRGRGLAKAVSAAAARDALANGLLPQWRARPESSRRVGQALGFRELGAQLSIKL